jgi:hypothetical protein
VLTTFRNISDLKQLNVSDAGLQSGKDGQVIGILEDVDIFDGASFEKCARDYALDSDLFFSSCERNAAVSQSVGQQRSASAWQILQVLFAQTKPPFADELLRPLFDYYANHGNVQMCVSMLRVLGDRFKVDEEMEKRWTESYIGMLSRFTKILPNLLDLRHPLELEVELDWKAGLTTTGLLKRFELWECAASLIKSSKIPSISELNTLHTSYPVACGQCGKPISQGQCESCNAPATCAVW